MTGPLYLWQPAGTEAEALREPLRWKRPRTIFWKLRVGKKAAGRLLDGREWNEVPA